MDSYHLFIHYTCIMTDLVIQSIYRNSVNIELINTFYVVADPQGSHLAEVRFSLLFHNPFP
jgi:hypothetical protein